jgi:hypothetical protein
MDMQLHDEGEGLLPAQSGLGLGLGRWGYVDLSGKWVIAPQFAEAKKFVAGHAIAKKGDKYGLIDRTGAWAVQPTWVSIDAETDGRYLLSVDDPNKSDATGWFDESGAWKQDKYALNVVTPGVMGILRTGTNNPADYSDLVDASGQSLLRPVWVAAFGEGTMPAHFTAELVTQPGTAHGAILLTYSADKIGKPALADEEDTVKRYAVFFPAEKRLLHGNWTTTTTYSHSVELNGDSSDENSVAKVLLFRDTGEVLTVKGVLFLKGDWSEGTAGFAYMSHEDGSGDGYALIDREGRRLLPQTFRDVGDFFEGVASACVNRNNQEQTCGAVDEQGHVVVPFEYDAVGDFHGGYAVVRKEVTLSILNRAGKMFDWPAKYGYFDRMSGNPQLFAVCRDSKCGVMRGDGKVILAPVYDDVVGDLTGGLLKIGKKKDSGMLYGIASVDGTVLQEPTFYSLEKINDNTTSGVVVVRRVWDGGQAVLDAKGRLLTDFDITDVAAQTPGGPWLLTERKQKRLLLADGTLVPLPVDTKEYALLADGSVLTETDNAYALADSKGDAVSAWYQQIDYLGDGLWSGQGSLGNEELFGADGRVQYTMPDDLLVLKLLRDTDKKRRRLLVMGQAMHWRHPADAENCLAAKRGRHHCQPR